MGAGGGDPNRGGVLFWSKGGLRRQQLLFVEKVEELFANSKLTHQVELRSVVEPRIDLRHLFSLARVVIEHLHQVNTKVKGRSCRNQCERDLTASSDLDLLRNLHIVSSGALVDLTLLQAPPPFGPPPPHFEDRAASQFLLFFGSDLERRFEFSVEFRPVRGSLLIIGAQAHHHPYGQQLQLFDCLASTPRSREGD